MGARVVDGRCLPYGESITYWPVVEVVKQLATIPSDPAAAAAWAFRRLLGEEAPLVDCLDDIQWGEETFLDLVEATAILSARAPILLLCIGKGAAIPPVDDPRVTMWVVARPDDVATCGASRRSRPRSSRSSTSPGGLVSRRRTLGAALSRESDRQGVRAAPPFWSVEERRDSSRPGALAGLDAADGAAVAAVGAGG
jgi:hypothetical protein